MDAGTFHGSSGDLEEEGGQRVSDQQIIEVQTRVIPVRRRRGKAGGDAGEQEGEGGHGTLIMYPVFCPKASSCGVKSMM